MNTKLQYIETKLTQNNVNSLFEKLEEKLKHVEEKFKLVDEANETFSNFVINACSNIDDLEHLTIPSDGNVIFVNSLQNQREV